MASEEVRSPDGRMLAERVLVTLIHGLGRYADRIVVLGGLVPKVLVEGTEVVPPEHQGTADVDLLLTIHLDGQLEGYESFEEILRRVGLTPIEADKGWRWFMNVDGRRLKVEFLCDIEGEAEGVVIRPPGSELLGAMNLRGTRYVAEDWTEVGLDAELVGTGGTVRVDARMAGLAGYLAAKAFAVRQRGEQKDYYDFAYVLIYNAAGGPEAAAKAIAEAPFAREMLGKSSLWNEIEDRYREPSRVGPTAYASIANDMNPSSDIATLRRDAVTAVQMFLGKLRALRAEKEPPRK